MPNELMVPSNRGKLIPMSEVDAICEEVRKGQPRRYIETFLKVEYEHRIVPMTLVENQQYFYDMTFGVPDNFKKGFWGYVLKDRKAMSSTFWGACFFAFLMNVPSYHGVIIGGEKKHAEVPLKMMDTFYNNLPDTVNPGTGLSIMRHPQTHWDTELREVGFGPEVLDNGKWRVDVKLKSSISISTSRSANATLGGSPNFLWRIESSAFDPTFEEELNTAVLNSPSKRFILIDDSTPKGTKQRHYANFKSIKAGEINAIYMVRYWFLNKVNQLSIDDRLTLPKDQIEVEKTGTLVYTQEEKEVIKLFPQDGVPVLNRILWRRSEMKKSFDTALGDEARGRALFLQEHMENDVDCWNNGATSKFDPTILRRWVDGIREPLPESKLYEYKLSPMPVPGLKFQAWQLPSGGGRYYGGMDIAKGRKYGDDSVLEIFDASTGEIGCAELFGKAPILRSVRAGADIMRVYNVGLFGPERNGMGEGAIEALVEYGYPNIYYPESGKEVSFDKITPRVHGWYTSPHSRPQMFLKFQEAVATGQIWSRNKGLIEDITQWNPDPESDEHAADRVMAAMIAYMMSLEAWRFPLINAQMPQSALAQSPAGQGMYVETPPPYSRWLH